MVDHPDHSPQPYPGSQRHQQQQQQQQGHGHSQQHRQPHQHYSSSQPSSSSSSSSPPSSSLKLQQQHYHRQQPHQSLHSTSLHHSTQTQRAYHRTSQDIQGPLSASVIEGHRAFPSFHGGLHRPRPAPVPTSYPSLSVADILERYQDVHKDFLVSILNAKAKEDERKAEEERYKTEQIRLQSKQLELEMALEKRRGSPPAAAGRAYPTNAGEASSNSTGRGDGALYSASTTPYRTTYPPYPSVASLPESSTSSHPYSRQAYREHSIHPAQDAGEQQQQQQPLASSSSSRHSSSRHASAHQPYQQEPSSHYMQPSPQSRPPSLKINTAVRHAHPKQQQYSSSSQRLSPQQDGGGSLTSLPSQQPGFASSKSSSRRYTLPALSSSSAQSSPVTNMDYQSHIPQPMPPLTPKDDRVSPTSAISPGPGQTLKRKSIHHDAVMDAVRAKVLRNAGQNQQQQREREQQQLHKKTTTDMMNARRKSQLQTSPLERVKRTTDNSSESSTLASESTTSASSTIAEPKPMVDNDSDAGAKPCSSESRSEGPLVASIPLMASPTSPSTPVSTNAGTGSGRSRSSTPPSEGTGTIKSIRPEGQNGYARTLASETGSSSADEEQRQKSTPIKYRMDRTHTDRTSEVEVLAV